MQKDSKCVKILDFITFFVEIAVAFILILAILILLLQDVLAYAGITLALLTASFDEILAGFFSLIAGVEFTKMLYKHTPEAVIEVLLFATARQVILSHTEMLSNLIGALTIAVLYLVKRYLLGKQKD